MALQLFASDLDGTLLNKESRISAETAKAVKRAQSYVLLNGAEFRTSSGKVVYQEAIEKNLAERIMKYLSAVGIDFEVNTDKGDFSTNTKVCQTALEIQSFAQIWNQAPQILKLFVFSDKLLMIEQLKNILMNGREFPSLHQLRGI